MADERKTLEQRHQMSDLERLRHSAAHVLATAILRIWPEAQFAAGPPVETGFYYDLDMPHRISPEDFPKIEEEMKKEIKANHPFERSVVSREEAHALALGGRLGGLSYRPENASKFKIGNLEDIPEGEEISLYRNGDFLDLCAGPHVMRTGNIGAFRLTHVASAYYKGDEKNPQLQRIYGTAFKNKTDLEAYFTMLEEAKKRDHRKLGRELELFCFDDDVGPGLPLWLPRGTVLIEELEKLAKETEFAAGYDRVRTPHLARENLYLTSGHLPYYAESMFPPMVLEGDVSGRVGVPPAVARVPRATPEREPGAQYSKRRLLPHFEKPWAIYFITISTRNRRVLAPESRTIVLNALRHFHGARYELFVACVMPDHAHFLFQPGVKEQDEKGESVFWSLGELMHSIKSFTAKEINRAEGTTGEVWEQERFDRYVRGDADLEEKFLYIVNNPRGENLVGPTEEYAWIWTPDPGADVSRETRATAGGTPTLPEAPTVTNDASSAGADMGRVGVSPAGSGILPESPDIANPPPPSGDRYYLKAMNCPHHHKLFGAVPRSYRDLPLRLAEYGTCYRYEQSGELFGLMRVRAMQMNDAHIYCTEEQFAAEFEAVNQMYLKYFKIFGIDRYQFRFSTHDPKELGKKFVDQSDLWLKTEKMVRDVLIASGAPFVEVANEAAFYGPKIDIQIWNIIGKEFTLATNQVDFAVPARFGLHYKTRENTDATPLCIHRAPLGTHERFIGFLIEHYAGNFPLWLSPEQVRILPIGDEEPLVTYAKAIQAELRAEGVRATLDTGTDPIKAKIAHAEQMKTHTMLVLGHRDLEAGNVSVRIHGKGNLGARPRAEVVAGIFAAIRERTG
ncbi:MAG: threonyl-tRNA synthetase [Chthoniobacter sp.]|jgi:threonyl-tRNA synthetase/REP element-mobilizing transposase RayT|nr:threonyl-tRNA synthetase [Chthoniobacter sp.]